ncbi:Xaa-Pro aminopeptidase [Oleiphilus sp. HI0009]|uniref:Xaa-Pro aminopeptidase n=5 Tax=Oleiphilus TaxID=141450 RepID=UPI0007C39E63|nr:MULTISPECIES: Xaa-Pro aminopeptidase [unclassified Oleiphilus]KZX83192.1 Xaa-Pro aminopeptidase [Oleiphilus sp. HI0009]KZY65292.1 Xaa-Pro aminopeptidase [Oleiphilus sp. HI0066]KZY68488.1 Xaa-Pro aminopeptidase [Oleiphilus sp. HI0067]MCH2158231.1 Xaa-Pro aminopeptidase [Oleiphilaceae bacterium]
MSIPISEYAERRNALAEHMGDNAIAILPSAKLLTRNNDAEFPFRQDSDFYYLTGFNEPDAVLALIPGREHGEAVLFCRERDPTKEMWDGKILGPDRALEELGVDDAFPISDIDDILPGLIEGRDKVFYALGRDAQFDAQMMEWVNTIRSKVRSGAHPPGEFVALEYPLHELRLFKSEAEIETMRRAAQISAQAHVQAMRTSKAGLYEYSLEAELLHQFVREGARFPAYSSIVGSGDNACILHYIDNNEELHDGDLVLIDAGCELDCYASDITRTFPVNGKFSKEQTEIYQIVLDAQEAAIAQVKPDNHWNHPHEAAVEVIVDGLIKLGLLEGSREDNIENETYKKFYMHRTGHWLGIDVHDVGEYKSGGEWRVLEPGMVMTVEPGIYIAPGSENVPSKYHGIGVRIEDDVVVTSSGYDVLTNGVPKTIQEIEALMAE